MKPAPFTWRGIRFTDDPHVSNGWRSKVKALDCDRTADWKVSEAASGRTFFARLRVGADYFPGRADTVSGALDAARDEAGLILRLIDVMLPRVAARRVRAERARKGNA